MNTTVSNIKNDSCELTCSPLLLTFGRDPIEAFSWAREQPIGIRSDHTSLYPTWNEPRGEQPYGNGVSMVDNGRNMVISTTSLANEVVKTLFSHYFKEEKLAVVRYQRCAWNMSSKARAAVTGTIHSEAILSLQDVSAGFRCSPADRDDTFAATLKCQRVRCIAAAPPCSLPPH